MAFPTIVYLSAFAPTKGAWAGSTYYLPPNYGTVDRQGAYDTQSVNQVDQFNGGYDMTGADPFFLGPATIVAHLDFTEWWVHPSLSGSNNQNYNYPAGLPGFETAWLHFVQAVVAGGLGTLTDTPVPGTLDPRTGQALQPKTMNAKVQDWHRTSPVGGPNLQADITFMIESGFAFVNGLPLPVH